MKLVVAAISVMLTACTPSKAPVSHPGAVNSFDSNSYDTLVTAQAAIESAKSQVGTNATLKSALQKAIDAYNVAESAYLTYHAAAVKGGTVDQTTLTNNIAALVNAVATLTTSLKGAPTK